MSIKIPIKIRKEILNLVYVLADREGYLTNNRVDNAAFLERLIGNSQVGGVLKQFMSKDRVRVYIKDSMLNRYAKDRRLLDEDLLLDKIRQQFAEPTAIVSEHNNITLYRTEVTGTFIISTVGTFIKWETALRKILLYIAAHPNLKRGNQKSEKIIVISTAGIPIPTGEEDILTNALSEIGVKLMVI